MCKVIRSTSAVAFVSSVVFADGVASVSVSDGVVSVPFIGVAEVVDSIDGDVSVVFPD